MNISATRQRGTADQRLLNPPDPSQTVIDNSTLLGATYELNRKTAWVRDTARLLHDDAEDLHGRAQRLRLDQLARTRVGHGISSLLEDLSEERGLGWSQIARLVGVSVPALRKWRLGQTEPSPENRMRLARLAAFFDLLVSEFLIQDPAGWLEASVSGTTLSGIDLYLTREGAVALLDLAGQRVSAPALLDAKVPDWRERHVPDARFRIETMSDGERSLVYTDDPTGANHAP